jgi:hypothetical protein
MSKINVNTWEPEGSSTDAVMMASSDTVTVPSGAELDIASGATLDVNGTIDLTGATKTGFPTGGFLGYVIYTGNDTYTAGNTTNGTAGDEGSASVTKCVVEVQAGGGGGGRATYNLDNPGGGGGGGSYARTTIAVAAGNVMTLVVGVAGAKSASSAAAGSAGGTSSNTAGTGLGFTTLTCVGGAGGGGAGGSGGLGGTVTSAAASYEIKIDGQNGAPNTKGGGDSALGLGGKYYSTANTTPVAGTGYGGGGSCSSGEGATGEDGTAGIIIIAEYA